MEFEFNLDEVLKERNMSIRHAATLCGLVYHTAYDIARNNQTRVDLQTLSRLATGLEIEVQELFRIKK
jgi:hypothetical protein